MDFIDDEDLVAVADRRHAEAFDDDLADLVDLGVGSGVDLDDVHVAPLRDFDARVTGAAGIRGRPGDAVQAAGEDARGGRLADPARPGKDERLRNPLCRDGVAERLRDTALPDDLIELLRAPLPRENLICHLR